MPEFRKRLLEWFHEFQRDLPWRRTKDPYRIWLSEIMLQQTRVNAVIPYFEKFRERFPDVQSLAAAPQEEVLHAWSGLGYYRRARNLQAAAKQIVAQHGGQFPRNIEEALALPGIGSYTGAAILSIAHGEELAVLDGNVARVLARLGAVRGDLREGKRWQALHREADVLLDREAPGDWNQAVMELGATVCTPRAPQCLLCPVEKFCRARQLGIAERLPEKRKKRDAVEITLAAAVLCDAQGRALLLAPPQDSRRHVTAQEVSELISGLWHFPTIQVKNDAGCELRSFLANMVGGNLPRLEPLATQRHAVTFRKITVLPFRIGLKKLPRHKNARGVALADLSSLPVSSLTRKISRAALGKTAPAPASKRA